MEARGEKEDQEEDQEEEDYNGGWDGLLYQPPGREGVGEEDA